MSRKGRRKKRLKRPEVKHHRWIPLPGAQLPPKDVHFQKPRVMRPDCEHGSYTVTCPTCEKRFEIPSIFAVSIRANVNNHIFRCERNAELKARAALKRAELEREREGVKG